MARGLRKLYDEIELPLTRVLARMERTGIRIDPARVEAPLRADGDGDLAAHRGDPRAGGQAVQHQLAAAIGTVLFEDLKLPAPEVRQGQGDLDRRRRAGRTGRGPRDRAQGAGVPAAHQAQGHLRGRAAGADRPGDRAPAHQLQPGGRGHRAALVVQSEPAEHSDPHGAGARDPRRLRAAPGMEAAGGRLFADRTAPAGAHVGRSSCWWRRSATARTSTRARRRR